MKTPGARQFLRVVLRRHRQAAAVCALITAAVGAAVFSAMPRTWRVGADVYVAEPVTIHRLANPFAPVPSPKDGLNELTEQLTAHEQLVALVKRVGLVDQWQSSRTVPQRVKDRVVAFFRGPPKEEDVLDALVAMLEQRLSVSVTTDHVKIWVEWPSRDVAFGLVEASVATLEHLRESRDAEALEAVARTLDDQLSGVHSEVVTRAENIRDELVRAAARGHRPSLEAETEQLRRDQSREADLMLRAEEKHISAEVVRRSNTLRFTVVHPAVRPKVPEGLPLALMGFLLLLISVASGVVGAIALSIAGGRVMSGGQLTRELRVPVIASGWVPWKGLEEPLNRRALVLVTVLSVACGVSFAVSEGNALITFAPLIIAFVCWALWSLPLKWPLLLLMLAAVTLDDPSDRPYYRLWHSPVTDAGRLFFSNIAWFTGFELAVMGLVVLTIARRLRAKSRALPLDPTTNLAPRELRLAVLFSGAAIIVLFGYGILRGGIFREALWQFRVLAMLPVISTLVMYAFDFPRDVKLVLGTLVLGSIVKSLLGMYFIYAIAYPSGKFPPHTTGHNDTMLFVTASVVCFLMLWEKPTWRHLFQATAWMAFVAMALRLNDRRIAYVDIAVALLFIYWVSPRHRMKRLVTQGFVLMLPVLMMYFVVGWSARSSIFKPVQKIRSIIAPAEETEEESSNVERDIENFNLLKSWEGNMIFGQGFGHAFTEFVPSNDFSQSNFGHVGHNSVLWLLWIGGIVGLTCVLLYLGIAAFFFARTLRKAQTFDDRVALLTALSIMVTYVLQAFGDMGTEAIPFDFFIAVALAIIGRLTTRLGAWPVPIARVQAVKSVVPPLNGVGVSA